MPATAKNLLGSIKLSLFRGNASEYVQLLKSHSIIGQVLELLRELNLPVRLDHFFIKKAYFDRAISIGYLLYRFSDKIAYENHA